MGLYYVGLRGTTASVATLAELCYPLTSLLIGLFLQHTSLSPAQWAGFGTLLVAVLGLSLAPSVVVRGRAALAGPSRRRMPPQPQCRKLIFRAVPGNMKQTRV